MKLTFLGADRTVTGSRHLIEINEKKILLDCGLFQGKREEEYCYNCQFPFDPKSIDVLILSHAHIDHSGNIPNLVKNGFTGPIYCTSATKDLCDYMLQDSGYIQEREAEYLNSKKNKNEEPDVQPLYTQEDAKKSLLQFKTVNYGITFKLVDGVHVTFLNAGHILGSAIIVLELEDFEKNEKLILTFTGDLGRSRLPILKDPEIPSYSDILITESTYGDKFHDNIEMADEKVAEIVNETARKGGKIIIPAFAVGRTQEIVYTLRQLIDKGKIPHLPVIVDSPLATNITEVFKRHHECYDEETREIFMKAKQGIFGFELLNYTTSVEDSKALNNKRGPMIIISASGMCEHGRILHHLKNSIEDPRNRIMIVGYQAENTLGRKLVDGEKKVNIFGKPYRVKAKIEVTNFFSAHGDRADLLNFGLAIKGLKKIFIVHGDEKRANALKDGFIENGIKDVIVPKYKDSFEIDLNQKNHLDVINMTVELPAEHNHSGIIN